MMPAAVSAKPTSRSFGRLFQDELEYLELAEIPALDRWLLTVLRVRYDPRRDAVIDRIDTLARKSGIGYRAVQRGLERLQKAGLITRKWHGVTGGRRGNATVSWTTSLLPYEQWPTGPLEQLIARTVITLDAYRTAFLSKGHAPQASPSPVAFVKDTPGRDEGHAKSDRRTRLATRDNPQSYPETSPERDAPFGKRGYDEDGDPVKGRVLGWVEQRRAAEHPFADDLAGRWLAAEIRRALADGVALADVDRAIKRHVEQKHADPRELCNWVAEVTEARSREERQAERQREWLAELALRDEQLARERAAPGYDERITRTFEEGRRRLQAASADVPA